MKRIFFGFEIEAPWPIDYPKGHVLEEKERHFTLVFLGNVDPAAIMQNLNSIPLPVFKIAPAGYFDKVLLLPAGHPRVVAWHAKWFLEGLEIDQYQKRLLDWLEDLNYKVDRRPLLSHVTVARAPFEEEEWLKAFSPLPCMIKALHLYESIGNLHYSSLWQFPFTPPFEEIEHTADVAFIIYGSNFQQLYLNAAIALSFKFPPLLDFLTEKMLHDLNEVVRELNQLISITDQKIGCPFKAVSYHGEFKNQKWQMIVDV